MDIYVRIEKLPEPDSRETCTEHYISVGGAATNYSITLSRIGAEAHLFVTRGSDIVGDLLETTLTGLGVRVHSKRVGEHTGMVIVIVDNRGVKYMISIPGANRYLSLSERDLEELRRLDHVHIVVSEREVLERIIGIVRKVNSISLGYRTEIARLGIGFLKKLDTKFRMIFLNRPEAELLFSARSLDDICKMCRIVVEDLQICDEVIVTLGEEGSLIYYRGGTILKIPSFRIEVVDTTGAGDVFAAVYTFSRLMNVDCYESSVLASAFAALKCTRKGASNVPDVTEVLRFLCERGYNSLVDKVRYIFSRKVNL